MFKKLVRVLAMAFVTSVLITVPLAFVLTVVNVGFTSFFWQAYVTNGVIAVVVSTLVSLPIGPLAARIVSGNHRPLAKPGS